jgi:hypothetical protein
MKRKVRKENERIKPTEQKKNIRVSNEIVNHCINPVKNIPFPKGKIASTLGSNDEIYTGNSCLQRTMMTKECTSLGLGRVEGFEKVPIHPMDPYSEYKKFEEEFNLLQSEYYTLQQLRNQLDHELRVLHQVSFLNGTSATANDAKDHDVIMEPRNMSYQNAIRQLAFIESDDSLLMKSKLLRHA